MSKIPEESERLFVDHLNNSPDEITHHGGYTKLSYNNILSYTSPIDFGVFMKVITKLQEDPKVRIDDPYNWDSIEIKLYD